MKAMKISQIRDVIQTAAWNRRDLSGHTSEEFLRCNVQKLMTGQLEALRALNIPARFVRDEQRKNEEIGYCEAVLARWQAAKAEQAPASTAIN